MESTPPDPSVASGTCPACKDLNFEETLIGFLFLSNVLRQAFQDCFVCRTFRSVADMLSISAPEDTYLFLESSRGSSHPRRNPILQLTFLRKEEGSNGYFYWHPPNFKGQNTFQIYTDDEMASERWQHLFYDIHVPVLCSIDDISKQARSWLAHCARSHAGTCPSTLQKLPTRLIAVGSAVKDPFLYTSTSGEYGSYAALSYCWGGKQTFSTNSANIETYTKGFDPEKLPATIRDAVLLTRRLGIRYLWVDSLCIIQDSTCDWEQEASKMCSVYSNSTVTYAAIDSQSSNSGLFFGGHGHLFQRIPGLEHPVYLRSERHMDTAHQRTDPSFEHKYREDSSYFPGIRFRALHERGWTLQEVMLSSRIIWFGADEISWSCLSGTACECNAEMTRNIIDIHGMHLSHPLGKIALVDVEHRNHRLVSYSASTITEDWVDSWEQMMVQFFGRRLSDWKDLLPAVSGLAGILQPHIGADYMSGLWHNETFLEQLLWSVKKALSSDELHVRSHPSRDMLLEYAPSWSWASVHIGARIRYFGYPSGIKPTSLWILRSVDHRPSTTNRFGPGQGFVTVHSWISQVNHHDYRGYALRPYPKTNQSASLNLGILSATLKDDEVFRLAQTIFDFRKGEDYQEMYLAGKLYFLFASVYPSTYRKPPSHAVVTGLLLEQFSTEFQTRSQKEIYKYRRVGVARMFLTFKKGAPDLDMIDCWQNGQFWKDIASQETATIY